MADIAHLFNEEALAGDWSFDGRLLEMDDGLYTAVLHSLFSDRRASEDDPLLWGEDGDRRGWWGDFLAETEGDQYGSKLWLLRREKLVPETARRAEEYAAEALAWMVEDGVVQEVSCEAELGKVGVTGVLLLTVHIKTWEGDRQEYGFTYPTES